MGGFSISIAKYYYIIQNILGIIFISTCILRRKLGKKYSVLNIFRVISALCILFIWLF
ncbi:putative membrane protein [[Clostridium] sordellii VPI 9048]|nr:putative membrane protein [[Clostridium] sordellii VPI 9048] [Paeniclostridium sordellii VPI 9048]